MSDGSSTAAADRLRRCNARDSVVRARQVDGSLLTNHQDNGDNAVEGRDVTEAEESDSGSEEMFGRLANATTHGSQVYTCCGIYYSM